MILLGISWSVTSTVALMIDGEIVACVSEERINRIKNYDAWPVQAIRQCLAIANVEAKDIDKVVFGSEGSLNVHEFFTHRYCDFSVEDMIKEQEEYWYPKIYEGKEVDFLDVFTEKIDLNQFPGKEKLLSIRQEKNQDKRHEMMSELRKTFLKSQIGIEEDKNVFLNHHQCHAYYAAFAMKQKQDKILVFTMDGSGDGENATVSLLENGKLKKLYGTADFIVGRLYRHATLLLGMKMVEHEYKVMGLAPYTKPFHSDKPYKIYKDTMYVDGLEPKFHNRPTDSYFYFKEKLKACRFDGIAGGIQRYLEDVLCQWVSNWMNETGVYDIAFSGGVSMNVKANLAVLQRSKPRAMYVPGSGGDESLAIGACYKYAVENGIQVKPLDNFYLGNSLSIVEINKVAEQYKKRDGYIVIENCTNEFFASKLAEGKVLGRCCGRMEFGARALGNRSILADPRKKGIVRLINDKIKSRDFWMPFAPVVIDVDAERYFELYDNVNYSCMTIAAETTEKGKSDLPAALHPADDTGRPQIITKQINEDYYEIIEEFKKITGVGCLLNTSLNIHGLPIVSTAVDAMQVLEETDIDGILIGNNLILKEASYE